MERVRVSEVSVASAERITKRICFSNPQVLVFVLTISPGQKLPPHRHPGSSLVVHVSAGTGTVIVDGNESALSPGDVLLVKGEEEFALHSSGSEPLVLLVSLSPNPTDPAYSREV